jgi:hypothetical protein
MSDTSLVKKLAIGFTMKEAFAVGIKNIGPILVNVLLWVLTVWIPYLNIGTTIGLCVGVITKASRGESISMTEIFDPKYRKYMGEFFLTSGLVAIGVGIGTVLFFIPGIIIGLAWSLAVLLAIDKGKNPIEAMALSNNLTYGYKLRMAVTYFLTHLIFLFVQLILMAIGYVAEISGFTGFLVFLLMLFQVLVIIGLQASIYRQLAENV